MKNIITIGMDLGDKKNFIVGLDVDGKKKVSKMIGNTPKQLDKFFNPLKGNNIKIIMETGTHSPWISEMLKEKKFDVVVVNSNKLPLISRSLQKNDMNDAELLAQIGMFNNKLLNTVEHRSKASRIDLYTVKSREQLIEIRTKLINHVRGSLKSFGIILLSTSTPAFVKKNISHVPENLKDVIIPILEIIDTLTLKIKRYDQQIKHLSETKYKEETGILRQVNGVGPITALTFILTLENSSKFSKSRSVGAFLGLTPKLFQSGNINKQLGISKKGNKYLRSLLVSCAQYILGPFGKESDLRIFGLNKIKQGGKTSKKKIVVAVARKLAVLLHHLWRYKAEYDPLYNNKLKQMKKSA